jgi:hypothetical protein
MTAFTGRPRHRTTHRIVTDAGAALITWEIDPVNTRMRRKGGRTYLACSKAAAEHSLAAIARDLDARCIRSRNGVPFSPQTLRCLLIGPVYIGKRVHSPGRRSGLDRRHPEQVIDGTWAPLVSEDVFYSVQRRMADPSRRSTTRPGAARHLLRSLPVCSWPRSG